MSPDLLPILLQIMLLFIVSGYSIYKALLQDLSHSSDRCHFHFGVKVQRRRSDLSQVIQSVAVLNLYLRARKPRCPLPV